MRKKPKNTKEQIIKKRRSVSKFELNFVISSFKISGVNGSLGVFGFFEHNLTAPSNANATNGWSVGVSKPFT